MQPVQQLISRRATSLSRCTVSQFMQTSCCLHTARPCELSLVLYDALFIRPPSEGASEMEPSLTFFLPIEVFSLALIFKLVDVLRESQRHMIEQSPTH